MGMLIATVLSKAREDRMICQGLRFEETGEVAEGPRRLVQQGAGGKEAVLLGKRAGELQPGWDGIVQCIRLIVEKYCKPSSGIELEWQIDDGLPEAVKWRLYGLLGGVVRSVRMNPEERRNVAMKGAIARHSGRAGMPPVEFLGVMYTPNLVHEGHRRWFLNLEREGDVFPLGPFKSRQHALRCVEALRLQAQKRKSIEQREQRKEGDDDE